MAAAAIVVAVVVIWRWPHVKWPLGHLQGTPSIEAHTAGRTLTGRGNWAWRTAGLHEHLV